MNNNRNKIWFNAVLAFVALVGCDKGQPICAVAAADSVSGGNQDGCPPPIRPPECGAVSAATADSANVSPIYSSCLLQLGARLGIAVCSRLAACHPGIGGYEGMVDCEAALKYQPGLGTLFGSDKATLAEVTWGPTLDGQKLNQCEENLARLSCYSTEMANAWSATSPMNFSAVAATVPLAEGCAEVLKLPITSPSPTSSPTPSPTPTTPIP